jgi:hypothetical protein
MITKIKALYANETVKEKLINALKLSFEIKKVSKVYEKEGPYKRIHIDLLEK